MNEKMKMRERWMQLKMGYGMENAMKFQGYLQMSIVFLEYKLSKLDDAEVRRQVLLEEL